MQLTMKLVFILSILMVQLEYAQNESMKPVIEGVCSTTEVIDGRKDARNTDHDCEMTVAPNSEIFFSRMLNWADPHLVRFNLKFFSRKRNHTITVNSTKETFAPLKWTWTYKASRGYYPYLSWNIDYGLLSFGLLDAQTLYMEPFVQLDIEDSCNITIGNIGTTKAIAKALTNMTIKFDESFENNRKYENSYYCFLAENPNIQNTVEYNAAVYFMYPVSYINYNCCKTCHDYIEDRYEFHCYDNQIEKWGQCLIGPYLLCVIIVLFFPVYIFKFSAYLSREEKIQSIEDSQDLSRKHPLINDQEVEGNNESEDEEASDEETTVKSHTDWIILDGSSPLPFLDIFGNLWCGLDKSHPRLVSKLKRLVCLVLAPALVYIRMLVYRTGKPKMTSLLLEHGTPMGFLSILGNRTERMTFAPMFGGPISLLLAFHVIGFAFLIIPKSLKQIVENGIPLHSNNLTPLCLGSYEIRALSHVHFNVSPGYTRAFVLCKSGIYLVFSKAFWLKVLNIQVSRVSQVFKINSKSLKVIMLVIFVPTYVLICAFEALMCIFYYGIPFCTFISTMVRGACKSLTNVLKVHGVINLLESQSILKSCLFRPLFFLGTLVVFATFLEVAYSTCLIFIESFYFLSEIVVFTFVSVIVFPDVAFGYLFFFMVIVYYLARLIRDFGNSYLDLLSDIVDISKNLKSPQLEPAPTNSSANDRRNRHSNLQSGIEVLTSPHTSCESPQLDPANINSSANDRRNRNSNLHSGIEVLTSPHISCKSSMILRLENDYYQIPKPLFDFIVIRHRPVHKQVLRVGFHIIFVFSLIAVTLSITTKYVTGPTSEISEVMHVLFIVIVGAIPRVLELAFASASHVVKRDIELRRIKRSVQEFWRKRFHDVYTV